jgi:tRNA 2-thiouridine synthesizing protein A
VGTNANIVVDARGQFCPIPIIKASEAMKTLEAGGVIEVISDDPAIEFDLPAWCESQGHRIESHVLEGDVYRYLVRKGRGPGDSP